MLLLITGLILFVGVHLFAAVPGWRQSAVDRLGKWPYKGLFAVVSLVGLVLAAMGYGRARVDMVWEGLRYGPEIVATIMPVACVLVLAAYMPTNIRRYTAHPMLWGVVLWALAHLLVKGHWAAIVLFGGLGLYALAAMGLAMLRGDRPAGKQRPLWQDLVVIVSGLVLYAVLLILHPILFGARVLI